MASNGNFKVVIVGAGVGGLTLANMLEKFDIDYVMLESHSEPAPQVGASIGMFPNGLRILDQIGCYKPIAELPAEPLRLSRLRDPDGSVRTEILNGHDHMTMRHGYPVIFFDRQWLLKILYDKIEHKEKLHLNKKVTKIEHVDNGVKAITADGETFTGSILVGVDGIWSTVRDIMIKLGHEERPGYFDIDESANVPCYSMCSFGIAKDVPNYVPGEFNLVKGDGVSKLVIGGPENRVYWFIFARLPEIKYGDEIPRYNKEDEAQFAKKYAALPITPKVTFGQIFAKRISSALTPLHETVFDKWFLKRILIFGDAAHKPDPIGGQGGNGAIESAAELLNSLLEVRDRREKGLHNLSVSEVEGVFEKMQSARHERAKDIVHMSHYQQSIIITDNPLVSTLIWNFVSPLIGPEFYLRQHAQPLVGTSRLKALPLAKAPHVIPYDDELPAKDVGRDYKQLAIVGFSTVMAYLFYVTLLTWRIDLANFDKWAGVLEINRPWTQIEYIGPILKPLVSVFSYALEGPPSSKLHLIYTASQIISPMLISIVEAHRTGNFGGLLSVPTLFMAFMQIYGIGRLAPIYAFLLALFADNFPTGRYVNVETANVLIPSLALGYVVPTILMLIPSLSNAAWQDWTAVWQFSPIFTCLLVTVLSAVRRGWKRLSMTTEEKEKADANAQYDRYSKKDVAPLKATYKHAFALQATAHIATLVYAYSQSGLDLQDMFFNLPHPFTEVWNLPSVAAEAATFFKYDLALGTAAIYVSNLFSVWQLRTPGYITSCAAIKAAIFVTLGQVVVGPGATWAGLWYWRESVLSGLNKY